MDDLFLKVLNMSISAGWVVLAVLALRLLLGKAPKWVRVVLWGLVGLRLVLPFSVQSVLSLIPSTQTVPADIIYAMEPAIDSGVPIVNAAVNPVLGSSLAATPQNSANPIQIWLAIASQVWLVGMVGMGLYALFSWLRIRLRVRESVKEDGVWLCDRIGSPVILGLLFPRIYVPSNLSEGDRAFVLAHERAHLQRRDHWWKPLGFLLLVVHWFNPVIWLGYVLLCRDIELACDEKVMASMGECAKKPYAQALINCAAPRGLIAACPLAFGENGIKRRLKAVLHYKKPAFWLVLVAVILCVTVAVCFLTDPVQADVQPVLRQPPKLTISDGTQSIEPWHGAHHWSYEAENGQTVNSIADANHPTAHADRLPRINVRPTTMSSRKGNTVALNFESAPDRISVTAWPMEDLSGDGMTVGTENVAGFDLLEGAYVYLVRGTWVDHGTAEYVFVGNYDVPVLEIVAMEMERLQAQYPQYFDLPTENGLVVYVWQMTEESYSCALTTGPEKWNQQELVWKLAETPVTVEEMRVILSSYNIDRSDITICPTIVPSSSYLYRITDEYTARVERRFWGEDDWGLTMDMTFTSDTAFVLTLTHKDPPDGSWNQLTVGADYAVIKYTDDGSLAVLKSLPDRAWDAALYLIPRNGQRTMEGNLEAVFGKLEAGVYQLQKTVTCTYADGVEEARVYRVAFAILDEE